MHRVLSISCLMICTWACFVHPTSAIHITLDFTLDENNLNWFGNTPAGIARRSVVESAAGFLSGIITNDDWDALASFTGDLEFTDIAASSIVDLSGTAIAGTPESDGSGFSYSMASTNRSSVAANEYVVYVGALAFDSAATAHGKASFDGADRRNAAGVALSEFNTWGGQIYFDSSNSWFIGLDPSIDPTDNYGIQDPNKMPATDISTDNWDWNTSSDTWKGFQLSTLDSSASGSTDLYGTALHEMIHALGMTTSNMPIYVGVNGNGDFIGENLVTVYGGAVPGDGGHFDNDVQSVVWDSGNIISEVLLDPNSTSGVRKYLTEVDAALLRDLGYQVLDQFSPADFNLDGSVDGGDLASWQTVYGVDATADADGDGDSDGRDFLAWQRGYSAGSALLAPTVAVPEPTGFVLMATAVVLLTRLC